MQRRHDDQVREEVEHRRRRPDDRNQQGRVFHPRTRICQEGRRPGGQRRRRQRQRPDPVTGRSDQEPYIYSYQGAFGSVK